MTKSSVQIMVYLLFCDLVFHCTLHPDSYFCNHEAHEEKSTKHTKKIIES
jgi:hypothetical protein